MAAINQCQNKKKVQSLLLLVYSLGYHQLWTLKVKTTTYTVSFKTIQAKKYFKMTISICFSMAITPLTHWSSTGLVLITKYQYTCMFESVFTTTVTFASLNIKKISAQKEWHKKKNMNGNMLVMQIFIVLLMQPSMGTLNASSSRVVKDSTPSRSRNLRCINFGIDESSPNSFLNMLRWIYIWTCLNVRAFYCFLIVFI